MLAHVQTHQHCHPTNVGFAHTCPIPFHIIPAADVVPLDESAPNPLTLTVPSPQETAMSGAMGGHDYEKEELTLEERNMVRSIPCLH